MSIPDDKVVLRKSLTIPSKPKFNNNRDNEYFDYIIYVGDVIGSYDFVDKTQCHLSNSRYKAVSLLGKGSFGQVIKCLDMNTNEYVALKILKNRANVLRQGMLEISILTLLNDSDEDDLVVKMLDHFLYQNHLCIVQELLGPSLLDFIKINTAEGIHLSFALRILTDLLESLVVLADNNIIHCDVKPENILITESKNVKLIDFGTSCFETSPFTPFIQTRHYRAPEVILVAPYTRSIDMWSVGCITAELFLGIPLFPGSNKFNQLQKILSMLGPFPHPLLCDGVDTLSYFRMHKNRMGTRYDLKTQREYEIERHVELATDVNHVKYKSLEDFASNVHIRVDSCDEHRLDKIRASLLDFLKRCLDYDASKRLTPQDALNHPFINNINLEDATNKTIVSPLPQKVRCSGEETLRTLCDKWNDDPTKYRNKLFSNAQYYDLFLKAFKENVVLNITAQYPFKAVPMTPPSLYQRPKFIRGVSPRIDDSLETELDAFIKQKEEVDSATHGKVKNSKQLIIERQKSEVFEQKNKKRRTSESEASEVGVATQWVHIEGVDFCEVELPVEEINI
ncbi:Serine/threonine protein kinase ppk15 [Entamoeba marina]